MQAQQARQTCHKVRRMRIFSAVPVCIWISIGGAADVVPSAALPSGLPALHADGDGVPQGRRYLHAHCIRPRFSGFQVNTERRQDRQQREQFFPSCYPVRPSDGARWRQGFARDWRGDHHAGSLDGFCPGQSARSVRGQVCRPQILAREYGTHRDGRLICRLTSESTQKASIILYGGSARSSSRSGRRSQ